ncbi:hypothetical protein CSQ88_05675 [Iodobacter sp. BJB302]|nr:hypothetical protein CSQ88_05675 [Iodobacter sp. BJB302]
MKTLWISCFKALQTSLLMTGIFSVITVSLASNYSFDTHSCLIFFSFMLIFNFLVQAKNNFFSHTKQNLTPSC